MHFRSLLFTIFFISPAFLFAQGIISGKITDEANNQPLVGATISILNSNIKTLSDVDGKYRLGNVPEGKHTLQVTYVGYDTKQIPDAQVAAKQVTALDILLSTSKGNSMEAVVIVSESRKESINSLLTVRRNSVVVSDAISAEMIRRSPDKNISDVLKRVSGTSIQENKFVIVRGMSDRYNEALLNGALLPSTEADRKTFSFDIFPSDIIDNVTVIKSASAEYPASFAGGLVIVNLKDVPDKNFFAFKTGLGYNTVTTGKQFYHQDGSSTDFLGLDYGFRDMPFKMPSTDAYNALSEQQKVGFSKNFSNDWALYKDPSAPMNTSLQLSGAITSNNKGNYPRYGALFALSYNSTYRTSHVINRDYGDVKVLPDSVDKGIPYYDYKDTTSTHTILSSALANFTIKVNPNNKFFFNNLLAVNSTIQSIVRGGLSQAGTGTLSPYYAYAHSFQSNIIYNGQVGGEHYLNKYKLRIKWLTYITDFHKDEPDYRQMIYFQPYENQPFYAYLATPTVSSTTNGGTRFYYNTKDVAKGINIDFNKSFNLFKNPQSFKFGFFKFDDARIRNGRFLRNDIADPEYFDQSLLLLPPDKIFVKNNFNSRTGFIVTDFAQKQWYYYRGSQQNHAGYVMMDNKLTNKLRLSYGVRYENYRNTVHSFSDANNKLNVDTTFHDLLPSANFIYSVLPKANLRLSYSRTLARPLYRELAATQFYDFLLNSIFYGTNLSETKIDNYEIRWEQYFDKGQYYSVSGFYKKFKDPIEQKIVISGADSKTITWQNVPSAHNQGIELEARKNLGFIAPALSEFYLYANTAFIKSVTKVKGNGSDTADRPMQGQSPYIINASVQYSNAKTGINVSALYNVIGERIFLVGGVEEPYIWEKPHSQLDFKISKTFLKNGLVELSFSNILHKNDVLFWDENGNKKYDADYPDVLIQSRNFGMTTTLSVGYRF